MARVVNERFSLDKGGKPVWNGTLVELTGSEELPFGYTKVQGFVRNRAEMRIVLGDEIGKPILFFNQNLAQQKVDQFNEI